VPLLVLLGWVSRRQAMPAFIVLYAGDVLWGSLFYVLFIWSLPRAASTWVWLMAVLTTELIEFSQRYRAPWIEAIRHTMLGGLLLGHVFLWSDVACVAIGATLAALLDLTLGSRHLTRLDQLQMADLDQRESRHATRRRTGGTGAWLPCLKGQSTLRCRRDLLKKCLLVAGKPRVGDK